MKKTVVFSFIIALLLITGQTGTLARPYSTGLSDSDGSFTIAVIPDTQQEVVVTNLINKNVFKNRTQWLVNQKDTLDLRYVIHTGDIVNWDTADHAQYKIASEALKVFDDSNIKYSLAIGNHDTAAVGPGGSAADPKNTKTLVRNTTTFNTYFPVTLFPGITCFEENKSDNSYQTFTAESKKWLVLTLELWPRAEAIAWARSVVENHASYNVIISTHSYLNGSGGISQSIEYGSTSPQYLYDNLIKLYSNIKIVFCGHAANADSRIDIGVNGNKIVTLLGCFHSNTNNPVQIVSINAGDGTISTRFYAPSDGQEWPQYAKTFESLNFVNSSDVSEKGDINNDGKITAADALLALQYSVKKITLTSNQISVSDVDTNGIITASDALIILQYSVQKITQWPE